MSLKFLALVLLLHFSTSSIFLSVKPKVPRCMIEFVAGGARVTSMKIKISFPVIENRSLGQHFQISIRNTETNQIDEQLAQSGARFYKEVQLQHNIIYEVCTVYKSDKEGPIVVQYEAENSFEDVESFSSAYPENLLKKEDFKEAFLAASHIAKTVSEYTLEHKSRESQNYKEFAVTQKINAQLSWVSSIELLVLVGAGIYQFFTLKNYLSDKQYI